MPHQAAARTIISRTVPPDDQRYYDERAARHKSLVGKSLKRKGY
jgi:hypothetical protein